MAPQRYVLSPEAISDLLDLEAFLTEREGYERALTVIARLHRAMTSLSDYPGIGRRRKEFKGEPQSYAVQSWSFFIGQMPIVPRSRSFVSLMAAVT